MAVTKVITAESGTTGAEVVQGSNVGGSPVDTIVKTGSGSITIDATTGRQGAGTKSLRVTTTATADTAIFGFTVSDSPTKMSIDFFFRVDALPAANLTIAQIRNGSSLASLVLQTTGRVSITYTGGSGTIIGAGDPAIVAGTVYKFALGVDLGPTGTGDGTVNGAVYTAAGALVKSFSTTTASLGTTLLTGARGGKLATGEATTAAMNYDDFRMTTGTSALLPPDAPSNAAPTVNAGVDQSNVEPWSPVTLTGTDSDSDGTVATRAWAQTGGSPTVTLAGSGAARTFEAPATVTGTTLTFQYSATDNAGATATDTMTVAVLPAAERILLGGVWTPARLSVVEASATPPPAPDSGGGGRRPRVGHEWSTWSRDPDYGIDVALPISSASGVLRHMGVSTAAVTTPFTPARWTSLQPSRGIELWRDGRQQFTGRVTAREATWDAETGRALIKVEAKGDESRLAKRLSFPDPLRAADDQTVNDYWMSRTGGTATAKVASTAMLQLISDQAGATCRPDRQISGLTLGPDPAVGLSRVWSALFTPVLEQLAIMSASSGANLGLRMTSADGLLTATIVTPRDLTDTVVFSADLSNLVGFTYRETEPDVTHALSAGQGDLHLRLRKYVKTTDSAALAWGEQYWSYIDRRDTADVAELQKADDDAIANGGPTVSLAVKLTDSQAATYDIDWRLGDAITVYVGLPGQTKVASVSDVCREIAFTVDDKGVERITPAIGTYDAKAVLPTPSQQKIAEVAYGLSGLIARK